DAPLHITVTQDVGLRLHAWHGTASGRSSQHTTRVHSPVSHPAESPSRPAIIDDRLLSTGTRLIHRASPLPSGSGRAPASCCRTCSAPQGAEPAAESQVSSVDSHGEKMMFDVRIPIVGTVLTPPERRVIEKTGAVVTSFRVVMNYRRFDRTEQQWVDYGMFR